MIVADASAIVELLLNTPAGAEVGRHLSAPTQTMHAPHLADVEVLHVLRRYAMTNTISPARAREALQDYRDMPMTRYPHDVLLPRIWELRHNFTAYDAAYIALAEALEAKLITCDRALASAPGQRAIVVVVWRERPTAGFDRLVSASSRR